MFLSVKPSLQAFILRLVYVAITFPVAQVIARESARSWRLPAAVSNNAVVIGLIENQPVAFSFNGLSPRELTNVPTDTKVNASAESKNLSIHGRAFRVNLITGKSQTIAPLPDGLGRLASIAVNVNNRLFVIGGYTVANDHSEKSTSEIYEYYPTTNAYRLITHMPKPVDDTVALVYQNRYIYLVSGWHDSNNVELVQVYDVKENQWFNATPFPGSPVFGHAGGIVNRQFVIADGVKVLSIKNGKRTYGASNENWLGEIDKNNPTVIRWKKLPAHPGKPLYRMASVGSSQLNKVIFVGGSDNPYNYDGIGYDKIPSQPSDRIFAFDLNSHQWESAGHLENASMDHRGLLEWQRSFFILGGMKEDQIISDKIQAFSIDPLSEK